MSWRKNVSRLTLLYTTKRSDMLSYMCLPLEQINEVRERFVGNHVRALFEYQQSSTYYIVEITGVNFAPQQYQRKHGERTINYSFNVTFNPQPDEIYNCTLTVDVISNSEPTQEEIALWLCNHPDVTPVSQTPASDAFPARQNSNRLFNVDPEDVQQVSDQLQSPLDSGIFRN